MHYTVASCHEDSLLRDPVTLPQMELRSTANYFLQKMSPFDQQKLAETLRALDGSTLRMGTTCSGTDVGANVVRLTFEELCRIHNAS